MHKAKAICQKILFSQRFYFKQLFLLLLAGSGIVAFAMLYAKHEASISHNFLIKSFFSTNGEIEPTVISYTDSLVQLKASKISSSEATLSWKKSAGAMRYTITVYRQGKK
jgi:hypothetical protein